jgi:hypothetical protein
VLLVPTTRKQTCKPEEGTLTISGLSCEIVDRSALALESIAANDWRGRRGVLKMGFVGLDYTEYRSMAGYIVDGYSFDGTSWIIKASNDLSEMKKPCMTLATKSSTVNVTGNLIDIWLKMLTSTGNGTNGPYDVLTAAQGIGFPVEYLDLDYIEQQRDDWLSGWGSFSFTFNERIKDFKAWADIEVFKLCGAILRNKDALWSIKARHAPLASEAVLSLTRSTIGKKFPPFTVNKSGIINKATFAFDYDEADNDFANSLSYSDTRVYRNGRTSEEVLGLHEETFKSKGMTSTNTAMLSLRKSQLFARYSFGPPELPMDLPLTHLESVALGEVVLLTDSEVPNLDDGTLGLTDSVMEIHSVEETHAQGTLGVTLVNTGYALGKYVTISGLAIEYDAATTEQKVSYGWIADSGDLLGTADDSPCLIMPG